MYITIIAAIVLALAYYFYRAAKNGQAAAGNLEAGAAFLKQNATRENVHQTANRLQYLVLQAGTGQQHAAAIIQPGSTLIFDVELLAIND